MNIKYVLKTIVTLCIEKTIPIKKNKFVFTSLGGHYSDSPRYISEAIHELDDRIEIVWLLKPQYMRNVPEYVNAVQIGSINAIFQIARAAVRIDNVYGDKAFYLTTDEKIHKLLFFLYGWLGKKRGMYTYTTWHGTPLKRMGRHQIGSSVLDFCCHNTTMFVDNEYTLKIMGDLLFNKSNMVLMGAPRNDLLYSSDKQKKIEVKAKLGLPLDKNVVLFAPTFRSDGDGVSDTNVYRSGINQLSEIDMQKLFDSLKRRFNGNWVFVCRFHYHVEELVDWKQLEQKYPGQVFNGNKHDDMADYLACADVLVTDASSCMFDFSLTYRPCFLFFPDYNYYKYRERGFYCDIESLPFSLAKTFDELIRFIVNFDEEEYLKKVKDMHHLFGYLHSEDAAKKIAVYILTQNYNTKKCILQRNE